MGGVLWGPAAHLATVSETLDGGDAQSRGLGRRKESLCRTLGIRLDAKKGLRSQRLTHGACRGQGGGLGKREGLCRATLLVRALSLPHTFQGPAGPRESLSPLRRLGSLTPSLGHSLLGGCQTWTFTSSLLLLSAARFCWLPPAPPPPPCAKGDPPCLFYRRTHCFPSHGDSLV